MHILNPRFLCAAAMMLAFVFAAAGCSDHEASMQETTAEVIYVGDLWNQTYGGKIQKVVEFKIDNNGKVLLVSRFVNDEQNGNFSGLVVGQKVQATIWREANGKIATISLGEKPI